MIIGSFSENLGNRITDYKLFMLESVSFERNSQFAIMRLPSANHAINYNLFLNFPKFFKSLETENIFDICGWVMTVCSLFVVIFFLCKNAPLIVKRNWRDDDASKSLNRGLMGRILSFIYKCLKFLYYFLYEFEVIYYVAYGSLALVATLTHPFFFSFHLTEILVR